MSRPMSDVKLVPAADGFPTYGVARVPDGEWEQPNGKPGFVKIQVYEVMGVTDAESMAPLFWEDSGGGTPDVAEADSCAEVMVRWDGRIGVFVSQDDSDMDGDFGALLDALRLAVEIGTEMVGA